MSKRPYLIVGGGWTGLSAAYTLSQAKQPLMLFEAAPQLGGRARGLTWKGGEGVIDNGQHILIDAYHETRALLQRFHPNEFSILERVPFQIHAQTIATQAEFSSAPFAFLPQQLRWILNGLMAQAWSWSEKKNLFRFVYTCLYQAHRLNLQRSVLACLKEEKQSERLIRFFWEPLLVAALSTPLDEASMAYALVVLQASFKPDFKGSDFLIPKQSLSALLVDPLEAYLLQQGHQIIKHQRITNLWVDRPKGKPEIRGLQTPQGHIEGTVLLSTSFHSAQYLLEASDLLTYCPEWASPLPMQSITTFYYLLPSTPLIAKWPPLSVLMDENSHAWLFRQQQGEQIRLSLVFSGNQALPANADSLESIWEKLRLHYPYLPLHYTHGKRIQEKQGAFAATQAHLGRFKRISPLPGLLIGGDYMHPNYPACLEGAVSVGKKTALMAGKLS